MADSPSRRTRVRLPCLGVAWAGTMDDRRQPGGATIAAALGGAARGARRPIECRHILPLSFLTQFIMTRAVAVARSAE